MKNKKYWREGEWHNEPDFKDWKHNDADCRIERSSASGRLYGFVNDVCITGNDRFDLAPAFVSLEYAPFAKTSEKYWSWDHVENMVNTAAEKLK